MNLGRENFIPFCFFSDISNIQVKDLYFLDNCDLEHEHELCCKKGPRRDGQRLCASHLHTSTTILPGPGTVVHYSVPLCFFIFIMLDRGAALHLPSVL